MTDSTGVRHTPGTWDVIEDDYGDELWFGGEGCGLIRVNGWANGGCKDEPQKWAKLQAEARLIAAAPDLLKALQSIATSTCCKGCQEAALVARAALDRVTGDA